MTTVAVIDYGVSNLRSVAKALETVAGNDTRITVTGDPATVLAADRVVFPGQGAIGDCMSNLQRLGLDSALRTALDSKPFLGLCLGLQTLFDHSAEDGGTDGFGFLHGTVEHFPENPVDPGTGERVKVPHMGWNQVRQPMQHALWHGIEPGAYFYFVHSYICKPTDTAVVAGTTLHAVEFCSAATRDNVFAVQFHPEKSQKAGLQLLRNFLDWSI